MKKRLLIFCDAYFPGESGGEVVWNAGSLAAHFSSIYDIYVITRDCNGIVDETPYNNVPRNKWFKHPEALVYYASPSNLKARQFAELVREVSPDLIFLNSVSGKTSTRFLISRRFMFDPKIPVIVAPGDELRPAVSRPRSLSSQLFLVFSGATGVFPGITWIASSVREKNEIEKRFGDVPVYLVPDLGSSAFSGRESAVKSLSVGESAKQYEALFESVLNDADETSMKGDVNGLNGHHPKTEAAKQRLWVVSEIYYPEEISTGYYLTSIAEGLAQNYDVKVICGQPNYASRGTRAAKHEIRNGVEIFRIASTTLDKNVIPFRVLNMFTLSVSMLWLSLRRFKRNDRILVVTAPPSLPFITAFASLLKAANYTLLLHDCYPEVLVAVGKIKPNSLFSKFVNLLNSWLYKHASKIIVVGRDMNELLRNKTNGLKIPIVFIPNWADLESVYPTPRGENPLLTDLGIADKFVFMYAGNIGHPTDIESIIECADRLRDKAEFHFVFVGSGAKSRWLQLQVERRQLKNVTILGQRPRREQIVFLNACDIGLVSLVKNMWGTAMPIRTYIILSAGKPILALTEDGSELARVIEEEGVGWWTQPGNVDDLQAKVFEIFQNREKLLEMGLRARDAALNKYSRASAIERYSREFDFA
jgi:glycosyltransferase involved in cell wall biosynthesis